MSHYIVICFTLCPDLIIPTEHHTENIKVCLTITNPLTALDLQRAGLRVQGKAAEVHVAHGGDRDSAWKTGRTVMKNQNRSGNVTFSELYEFKVMLFVSRMITRLLALTISFSCTCFCVLLFLFLKSIIQLPPYTPPTCRAVSLLSALPLVFPNFHQVSSCRGVTATQTGLEMTFLIE